MSEPVQHKILLVGHCTPDAFAMRTALGRYAPDVEFVFVNDDQSLADHDGSAPLLVNRVLDGRFSASGGIDLIRSLPAASRARAALISDLPDAQAEATAEGASPGFGKRQLYSEAAETCVRSLLDGSTATDSEKS